MAETIRLVAPKDIKPNPENPRLIFHADELAELQDSIERQGVLVPLTVYEDTRSRLFILDGERRWRCALKLGLSKVPVIVQPQPDRMQNIMMMFAIHHAREAWDPLPTAYKLLDLEGEFSARQGRTPTETELAQLASITRGEVRRLKNLLKLPEYYRAELMAELEKPRSKQLLTVDHVLETTKGVSSLRKRGVINATEEDRLRRAIIDKFRRKVIRNTVDPRKLAKIARAVAREELEPEVARAVSLRLIRERSYSIAAAFTDSVEQVDFSHSTEQLVDRVDARLREHVARRYRATPSMREALEKLQESISRVLG